MYNTWRPAAPVLGTYPAYSQPGEVQPADRMTLQGAYPSMRRFSLAGWSANEWATFFESAGPAVSQVYGTIFQRPVAQPPVPIVSTPIGGVPTWAIVALVATGGILLLSGRQRRRA